MFDFVIHITKEHLPEKVRFNSVLTKNYLVNILYSEELYQGAHFKLSALVHEDANEQFQFIENEIAVFVLGNAYTTKAFSATLNSKPHRVEPQEVLKMYKDQGKSFINNLKGIFTILVLDEVNGYYQIFSSRNALYDTYYLEGPDFLIASSSIEAILKYPGITPEIDPIAIIQHSIFDYPLGEKTLFSNVSILPASTCLSYNLKSIKLFKYFDYLPCLKLDSTLNWKETYAQTPSRFNEAIDLIIEGKNKLCASLTSGFDSRTNLSRLYNSGKDILYYSWGMPGSVEIQIPQRIASETGIHYEPVYLDTEFEKSYDYFGKQAIMWSGGKGTIRRANHTFGYSRLFNHSHSVITGLFGSELLRPANAVGHIFNQAFIDVLYAEQQQSKLLELFDNENKKGFLQPIMLSRYKEIFLQETLAYFAGFNKVGEKYMQLYYFTLTEGFRKYFGHEINGCRPYVEILSPYIDDDFVEFILSTPIPSLNKYAFKRNPRSLKRGQSFYLPIIEKNFSKLMKIPTGRFYSPAQLKSLFFPFSILPGYIRHMKRRKADDTFDTHRWNNIFLKNNQETLNYKDEFLKCLDNSNFEVSNNVDQAKQLSLRFWLIQCFKKNKE